jgi:hypothetical protein
VREGGPLWGGVKLGRLLGAGVQVGAGVRASSTMQRANRQGGMVALLPPACRAGCAAAALPSTYTLHPPASVVCVFPQAKVFELAYNDGRPTGKVLKISHTGGCRGRRCGAGGTALSSLWAVPFPCTVACHCRPLQLLRGSGRGRKGSWRCFRHRCSALHPVFHPASTAPPPFLGELLVIAHVPPTHPYPPRPAAFPT